MIPTYKINLSLSTMASIYSCTECGSNLNLHTVYLFAPDFYFEAGNKGTLSFAAVDSTKFKFEKENKRSDLSSRP